MWSAARRIIVPMPSVVCLEHIRNGLVEEQRGLDGSAWRWTPAKRRTSSVSSSGSTTKRGRKSASDANPTRPANQDELESHIFQLWVTIEQLKRDADDRAAEVEDVRQQLSTSTDEELRRPFRVSRLNEEAIFKPAGVPYGVDAAVAVEGVARLADGGGHDWE
jgi:hypothetical protein